MSDLIWIETVCHSDGIPENFSKDVNFEKSSRCKQHANLPSMQSVQEDSYFTL